MKGVGIMVKAKCSPTEGESPGFVTVKLRQSIAITALISRNARVRPGQKRGPPPKGTRV